MNSSETAAPSLTTVNCASQIRIKPEGGQLVIILPAESETNADLSWTELCSALNYRLLKSSSTWCGGMKVYLQGKNRLLDGRQLQILSETLDCLDLKLVRVITSRRQTAVAAASAGYSVEQQSPTELLVESNQEDLKKLHEPLYLEATVRSGSEIRHQGTVIILGDLNPGGTVIAAGDIIIWGILRGLAHAGAMGNRQARIMALRMEPTQLRIAELLARAPDHTGRELDPELAYITKQGIRITRAVNFAKTHTFVSEVEGWAVGATNKGES